MTADQGGTAGWRERLAAFLAAIDADETLVASVNDGTSPSGYRDLLVADVRAALVVAQGLAAAGPGVGLDREALASEIHLAMHDHRDGISYCSAPDHHCFDFSAMSETVAAALAPLLTGGGRDG